MIMIAATECIVDQDFVSLIFKMCTKKVKKSSRLTVIITYTLLAEL